MPSMVYSPAMPKKRIEVRVREQLLYEVENADVCMKSNCLLVHNGSPLFVYAMMPGQYAKFVQTDEGVKIKVDE